MNGWMDQNVIVLDIYVVMKLVNGVDKSVDLYCNFWSVKFSSVIVMYDEIPLHHYGNLVPATPIGTSGETPFAM